MTTYPLDRPALIRLPKARISTHVAIAAPPSAVWALIVDPAAHLLWNPNMRRMEGRLQEGETFLMSLGAEGKRPMTFRPKVLSRREGHHVTWRGRLLMPGLFDGTHTLRVKPDGQGGSLFFNEESFSGLLLAVMGVEQFRPDFEAANAGLKRLAEGQAR
ncbi:MAG: hypothetical protein RL216_830 [Pseudomonadota bacterium]